MMWEYHFEVMDFDSPVSADPLGEEETRLNALGKGGWEVVAMLPKMGKNNSWSIVLLKRPVPEDDSSN
jgi:hypothetical protein